MSISVGHCWGHERHLWVNLALLCVNRALLCADTSSPLVEMSFLWIQKLVEMSLPWIETLSPSITSTIYSGQFGHLSRKDEPSCVSPQGQTLSSRTLQ